MFKKVKSLFNKKPKYSSIIEASHIKVYDPSEQDIYEAKASYNNLKAFLPKDIDFERSYDLLGISFSAFVSSRANKNGQVISGADAKALAPTFIRRPINKEHRRQETVGVITNYGFSEFGTEKPLTEDEVDELIAKEEPFNVNLGGVLWKVCDPEYIENLIAVNSFDSGSRPYFCSWEVGFQNFKIAEGSKNLAEARIISDDKEIQEVYKNLSHFSGSGINPKTNKPIYLLIDNEDNSLQALGIGITKSPAADVGKLLTTENLNLEPDNDIDMKANLETEDEEKAVLKSKGNQAGKVYDNQSDETKWGPTDSPIVDTAFDPAKDASLGKDVKLAIKAFSKDNLTDEEIEAKYNAIKDQSNLKEIYSEWNESNFEDKYSELIAKISKKQTEDKKIEKEEKNSVIANTTVKKPNKKITYMKLTSIDQINDEALTNGEIKASALTDLLEKKIEEGGAKWAEEKKAKEDALALATQNAAQLNTKLSQVEAELNKLRDEAIAREKAETFNTRLEGIASEYDFDDEEKSIVAERIKDLDDDGFNKYLKELSVIAKAKMKKQGEKDKEDEKLGDEVSNLKKDVKDMKDKKKDAKASELFASLVPDKDQQVPLNPIPTAEDFRDRWSKGFKVSVTK